MLETAKKPEERQYCHICKLARQDKGLPPQELIVLPIKTDKSEHDMFICPTCDSGALDLIAEHYAEE